ncbi:MAG: hypothetical protein KJO79_04235, partial [Verrucomicrobiae bacterium]|nr:hypothetical protein [Verrucomicrobiae bacterium]NNJ86366.1 hypothetical protein [Akkermansiaceae bacterium]
MNSTVSLSIRHYIGILFLSILVSGCAEIPYEQILNSRHVGGYLQKNGLGGLIPPPRQSAENQTSSAASYSPVAYSGVTTISRRHLREPSGICWHPGRKTLFAVDDGGGIAEITPGGKLVRKGFIPRADLEGITTNPKTGLLYAVSEGDDRVLEIDPGSLRVRRIMQVPRRYNGRTVMREGGNGIEAITFIPKASHREGGVFCVANQGSGRPDDDKGIYFVELPIKSRSGPSRIVGKINPPVGDIAGLHYDRRNGNIIAISDHRDT